MNPEIHSMFNEINSNNGSTISYQPNTSLSDQSSTMVSEESMCMSLLKNKRMFDQQKSKRKAFLLNLRKKMYEETILGEGADQSENINDKDEVFQSSNSLMMQYDQNIRGNQELLPNMINTSLQQEECDPEEIIQLIKTAFESKDKLDYRESRRLKIGLTLLRKHLRQESNEDGNSNSRKAWIMQQLFEGMFYILKENEQFSMDIVYECVWNLSDYSSAEHMGGDAILIYEKNAEVLMAILENCAKLVNQQQASILLTKIVLILGNLCLESPSFCSQIVMGKLRDNTGYFCDIFKNTILYLPSAGLIAETIWLLSILFKTRKFCFESTSNFSKNIAYLLSRFKNNARVAQELLWYLISLSQECDDKLHEAYFDENVLSRVIQVLSCSQHSGNSIACLTLLTNCMAVLPLERLQFLNEPQIKCELLSAIEKCINSTNVCEIQRECLIFLSNVAVVLPLFLAQQPELLNLLISLLTSGKDELFVDLCYLFSNLLIQLPESHLLAQQHPHLRPLLTIIITDQNIQNTYSHQLAPIFTHFANFINYTQ